MTSRYFFVGSLFFLPFLLLIGRSPNSVFLRKVDRNLQQQFSHENEPITPYVVSLTLAIHHVEETMASRLESRSPDDAIVRHFCQSVNIQAGGSQVRKAALEHDVLIESRSFGNNTQCEILSTRRFDSETPDVGFFSLELSIEQVVYAGFHVEDGTIAESAIDFPLLTLAQVYSLVEVGFNRGRGGRFAFLQLLQANSAFANVNQVNVIYVPPTPMPSQAPTNAPTPSPTTSQPTTSRSLSSLPVYAPMSLPTLHPNASLIPSIHTTLSPIMQPTASPSASPSTMGATLSPTTTSPTKSTSASPSTSATSPLPSFLLSEKPSNFPTVTSHPSATSAPSAAASLDPTISLTPLPTTMPSIFSTSILTPPPSVSLSAKPFIEPSTDPSVIPTSHPSDVPSPVSSQSPVTAVPSSVKRSLVPSVGPNDAAGLEGPTSSDKRSISSEKLHGGLIAGIVCGAFILLVALLSIFVYPMHRVRNLENKEQDEEPNPQYLPRTPSHSRSNETHKSTPKRGNTHHQRQQSPRMLLSAVPNHIDLDDDGKSLAETTLGEHTAGRKPSRRKRIVDMEANLNGSFEDESIFTSPNVVPPTAIGSKTARNSGVFLNREDEIYTLDDAKPIDVSTDCLTSAHKNDSSAADIILKDIATKVGGGSLADGALRNILAKRASDAKGMVDKKDLADVSSSWSSNGDLSSSSASSSEEEQQNEAEATFKVIFARTFSRDADDTLESQNPVDSVHSATPFNSPPKPQDGRKIAFENMKEGRKKASTAKDSDSNSEASTTLNPWLYDAVERTLGPRSKSADMESISGRSNKSSATSKSLRSQASDISNRSFSSYLQKRGNNGDSPGNGSRRSGASSAGTNLVSNATRRTYETELLQLESQLAKLNPADNGNVVDPVQSHASEESFVSPLSKSTARTSQKQRIIVVAPPGKLGVILANRRDGKGTVVTEVRPTSALQGRLVAGDKLIAIDETDCTKMIVSEITALMSSRSNKARHLTVITSTKLRESVHSTSTSTAPISSASESDVSD